MLLTGVKNSKQGLNGGSNLSRLLVAMRPQTAALPRKALSGWQPELWRLLRKAFAKAVHG